jgi:hypothetical protein
MNKEFIPYNEALALKEIGYISPSIGWYKKKELVISNVPINYSLLDDNVWADCVLAPLNQQALRWFRTEHKMKFHIHEDQWNHWCTPEILIPETGDYEEICDSYETFREAELECLKKLIEIVNQNKDE